MDSTKLAVVLSNANVGAFLRVIREGESSQDDAIAYRMVNGGGRFESFAAHPYGELPTTQGGRAAGAYQFLPTTWAGLRRRWPTYLVDFSPASQDAGAVLYLYELGALDDVLAGRVAQAIARLGRIWTSLPNGTENSGRYTLAKALAVFTRYGGKLAGTPPADTQPAAPIEDRSTPYVPPQPEAKMPAALIALAQVLISAFTPVAQSYIAEKVNKAAKTGDPTVGEGVAKAVIDSAQQALGIPDRATPEATAAAVVAAAQDKPDVIATAQESAIDFLEKIGPLLDKIGAQDLKAWEAEDRGRDAAAARGRADENDLAPMLAWAAFLLVSFILTGLFAIMGVQVAYSAAREPSVAMLTLVGPILGTIVSLLVAVFAYRFGTTRNNSIKDLTVEQLSRRK